MLTIADIVDAVASPYAEWLTLRGIKPVMRDGRPLYVTGNAAVSFRVEYQGRAMMLKCYTRQNPRLGAIYGAAFHPRELVVRDVVGRSARVDCLLVDYIEGRTLDEAFAEATSPQQCCRLAEAFDHLAAQILSSERAHGDLKPENIIVDNRGQMHAIDWDAAFDPRFEGERALEIGTAAYQHPERGVEMYDRHIDDYSIAMISTMLHAATIDEAWAEHYGRNHEPLIHPRDIQRGQTLWLDRALEEFARRGMARQYRVAQMLRSPYARLFRLRAIFLPGGGCDMEQEPTLDVDWGWWGCRRGDGWAVSPLYDSGFEPLSGVALMMLDGYSHIVSVESGQRLMSFDRREDVRLLRNGVISVRSEDGEQRTIDVEELINSAK